MRKLEMSGEKIKAKFHLPGLFEFYSLYEKFLPLYFENNNWFYDWCEISSIYGAPCDAIWGGGRAGFGERKIEKKVYSLLEKFGISGRLAFSNSLIEKKHLSDENCNILCKLFEKREKSELEKNSIGSARNGIIVHSDLLLEYLKENFPGFYFVSSTTKVLTDFEDLRKEINRQEFDYVVPDFRLNKKFSELETLNQGEKNKIEFLCNECCWFECKNRKKCYENVSKKVLGIECDDWICTSPNAEKGYIFSESMKNPGFIGIKDIKEKYLPMGFSNFKIEGRSLGSAMILEFLLYYLTKPEYQLNVREAIYLDNTLDLF